jgi:hypothetical protein
MGMKLMIARVYELANLYGVFAKDCCDKCGRLLGAVRFTRRDDVGEWCSRECRGDVESQTVRKGGRPRKYRSLEERRSAKTRQQRDYRDVAVWKKPSRSLAETNHLQAQNSPLSTIPLIEHSGHDFGRSKTKAFQHLIFR